jgi:uncharacterized protein YcfJ
MLKGATMGAKLLIKIGLLTIVLSSCTAMSGPKQPQFYPNAKLQKTSPTQLDQDKRYCMSLADEYVKDPSKWKTGAINTAETATAGAAAGAVTGAIMGGGVGRYVAAGAAVGAIAQVLKEVEKSGQNSPNWEKFVEQCMAEKGYQVYSWQ